MTGPGFDSLYYTDCVPGQGLRGGAGFQFQAVSPGVVHDTMSLVQRSLLYEAPVAWMREQRDAASYPPSLSHVFADGVYATARGRYLGAEANGVREGNQFTHAISTADPEVYGLTRPAQLWDASWWAEKPASTTECDRLPADPEAGPWGIDSLREWVLGRPAGEEWLLALHSALDVIHEPDSRRVLFVGEDAAEVLGWIAAGTLLLAQSRALRVGFRVFTTNARQSRHDILAVHDDWAGPFADPDRDHGFVVFNLTTRRHSTVEPTEGARYWVPRFLREDPYDVVDAIELAQRFAGSERAPAEAERLAAAVAVLGERPTGPAETEKLVTWLGVCPAPQPEEVVQPVVGAVLAVRPDLEALRGLRVAAERHRIVGELADRVVTAVFAAELAAIAAPVADTGQGLSLLDLAERAAGEVAPAKMNDLLLLASRFGVEPRVGRFAAGAHRFAEWWVDHPGAVLDPDDWSCGAQMVDLVRDALAGRLGGPDEERFAVDVNRVWWRRLLPTATDPTTPLDEVVFASAVQHGSPDVRRRTIEFVLSRMRDFPAEQRGPFAWRALFSYSRPTAGELIAFLRVHPPGPLWGWLDDEVALSLDGIVGTAPDAEALDAVALALRHSSLPGRSRLTDFAAQDKGLRNWLAAVSGGRAPRPVGLRQIAAPVFAARSAEVVDAFVGGSLPVEDAIKVIDLSGGGLAVTLLTELPRRWRAPGMSPTSTATAVALVFAAAHVEECPETLLLQAERSLKQWHKSVGRDGALRVAKVLEPDERTAAEWREFTGVKAARTTGQTGRAKAKDGGKPPEEKTGWRLPRRGKGGR